MSDSNRPSLPENITIFASLVPLEFRNNLLMLLKTNSEVRAMIVEIIREENRQRNEDARRQLEAELSQQFSAIIEAAVDRLPVVRSPEAAMPHAQQAT